MATTSLEGTPNIAFVDRATGMFELVANESSRHLGKYGWVLNSTHVLMLCSPVRKALAVMGAIHFKPHPIHKEADKNILYFTTIKRNFYDYVYRQLLLTKAGEGCASWHKPLVDMVSQRLIRLNNSSWLYIVAIDS